MATPAYLDELPDTLAAAGNMSVLPVGLGRSYGDSCLNSRGGLIQMTRLDRLIAFDRNHGTFTAEAGLTLADALAFLVPQGFFLPTTPGTRFVTLGGAVANDVHGKNHHVAGTFGCSLQRVGLLQSTGERKTLTPDDELFRATVGGLGLTGLIEWVELSVPRIGSAYLQTETTAFNNLDGFFDLASEAQKNWEHTVAWADCVATGAELGRGIFSCGRWLDDGDLEPHTPGTIAVPLEAPPWILNRWTLQAFNTAYYGLLRHRHGMGRTHYAPFLYPLDAIGHWNRLYGRPGFYQYQCVVPPDSGRDALRAMFALISSRGAGSFLVVLKTFGDKRSPGFLSFPRPGVTFALDFPNHGTRTLALMSELDAIVRDAGGALYPAKDGRMSADMFRRSFPAWETLARLKDPKINSDFWMRVAA